MQREYNNVWGLDFRVRVMDVGEICAEKIRAMSDRARYRDFYDLFLLVEKYKLELTEVVAYLGRKEIQKPISKANILQNWSIVSAQKRGEMDQVFYAQEIDGLLIQEMLEGLPLTEITGFNDT